VTRRSRAPKDGRCVPGPPAEGRAPVPAGTIGAVGTSASSPLEGC